MIRSSMKLKNIGEIGLSYAFTLAPDQTLEAAFIKYNDDMQDALKVLLATGRALMK